MKKMLQDYLQETMFTLAVDREEQMINKYETYEELLKNEEIKKLLKEYKKISEEHIKILNKKMSQLNISQ